MQIQLIVRVILVYFLVFKGSLLLAQNSNRSFINFSASENAYNIKVSDGIYKIEPFNTHIFHTTFLPNKIEVSNFSYAVEIKPNKIEIEVKEGENEIIISSAGISATIIKEPFNIIYHFKNKLLFEEKGGYSSTDSSQLIKLSVNKDEILYGAGARVLGMNRRGHKLELYNRAHYGYETHSTLMNYSLPLYISSEKYAVLFDNASKGWLDLDSKKDNTVTYETVNGTINYYVIADTNWYGLVDNYTKLTGRQALPPRWAFGNFSSRFGYHSQNETEQTIQKFIDDTIPVDAVIIDIYWFGKDVFGHMGNLDWHTDSFPNAEQMIQNLKNKGVKTILVTEPFVLTTSKRWQEAVDAGAICTDTLGNPYKYDFFFGNTGLVDLYKKEGRDWFWNIYKKLTKQGVAGWWGDLGEPEVHPKDLQHAVGSADDIHNAYGHEWAKLVYEGFENDFADTRPFILMRAGFAGSQRYGLIPWSGDVNRTWGGLYSQPEISLQMGMQGLAYMHSDLGGFAGGDSIDNELYIRWLQYGVFQPIYRPHAQEKIPAEPVFHNDTTKAHAKTAIELRYKLLPYIYNMAYQNSISGKPLMIPLFFNESDNTDLLTYDKAYMWGDAFLVAPIKKAGQKTKELYLPKNSNWINFYTNKEYVGGKIINVPLHINNIPIFIKAGSFIPMKKEAKNTESYNLSEFELHYYHSQQTVQSSYSFYNDDGKTPLAKVIDNENYQISSKYIKELLSITIKKSIEGKEISPLKSIKFVIHNVKSKPKSININNKKIKNWTYLDNCLKVEVSNPLLNENCLMKIQF